MEKIISVAACIIAFLVFVTILIVFATHEYVSWKIDREESLIDQNLSLENLEKEHYRLAWANGNHFKVIAFTRQINHVQVIGPSDDYAEFMALLALVSDYYGQGNRLLRQGKIFLAWEFYDQAFYAQESAMEFLKDYSDLREILDPLSVEVLWAPQFAFAQIPIIGRWYRSDAISGLKEALALQVARVDYKTLAYALIASKLWQLTEDEDYLHMVYQVRISADTKDQATVGRIARHLGISAEELYRHSAK